MLAIVLVLGACTSGGQFDPTEVVSGDMFSTKKKFRHEIFASSHFRCKCWPCRPPIKSSSIPISAGIFLNGFFAYAIESGTRIARDHEEIS